MYSHWSMGALPRNTSNGDYGRFLFTSNQYSGANANNMASQYGQFSTNGNRMVQHMHYPNCPNRHNPMNMMMNQNQGVGGSGAAQGQGEPQYTIEYGEEAVRKALGGNMPDFQAHFNQQYGNGSGDGTHLASGPQAVQMKGDGNMKMGMIPVVLTEDNDDGNASTNAAVNSEADNSSNPNPTQAQAPGNEECSPTSGEPVEQTLNPNTDAVPEPVAKPLPPKPETLINAFDSVRKMRSSSEIKFGRHVRPSYWHPEIPNPCRKKMGPPGVTTSTGDLKKPTPTSTPRRR